MGAVRFEVAGCRTGEEKEDYPKRKREKESAEKCLLQDRGYPRRVFDGSAVAAEDVDFLGDAMLAGVRKGGRVDVAEGVCLELMPERDVISWSCMIMGYIPKWDFGEGAGGIFRRRQMIGRGLMVSNEATLVTVLSSFSSGWDCLNMGGSFMSTIKDLKFPIPVFALGTALSWWTCIWKCGCIDISRQVFGELPGKEMYIACEH
ncbi:hypothetical protein J5N97_004876 [Dioscorea zingiberensis]|uniref:Uncharacterized protein n=1 Tax=Dioscorea zingiberensis TaxID=325984 RepID=A0A9D5HRC7_9LILI|nr:hypothetical protein J5N97_004876 [Dioscorea zingiberensis]